MRIKSVTLKNIRTYTFQKVEFPDAQSVMLSGDIGCGKSSILLAIEFALFGILKGDFSAESLLRKGATEGSVIVDFEINQKKYQICRNLKKSVRGIAQTSGYIQQDDIKTEGTAMELKNKILDILGYPQSLLTTSKAMIYRYTVYTPQEQMKRIIEEDEEQRLDILRKVFNMDKYKRIRDNTHILISYLKEQIREDMARAEKLPEKEQDLKLLKENMLEFAQKLEYLNPLLEKIQKQKKESLTKINELEEKKQELDEKKKQYFLLEKDLQQLLTSITDYKDRKQTLFDRKVKTEEELKKEEFIDETSIRENIQKLSKEIEIAEKDERDNSSKIVQLQTKFNHSGSIIEKMKSLDNCPQCLQSVTEEHKTKIIGREKKEMAVCNEHIHQLKEKKYPIFEKKKRLDELKNKLSRHDMFKLKKENVKELTEEIELTDKKILENKKKIGEINVEKQKTQERIDVFKGISEKHTELKKEHDSILDNEREVYAKISTFKGKKEENIKIKKRLEEEIAYLTECKNRYKKNKSLSDWLKDHFTNLVELMERHVMLKIQQEFNQLFQEWFNFLIEDENINVVLDDRFTPLVEQNGYDIDFRDLSGGEKTSVALAYRLALNKVINDLISDVNTKDFIVLDEPTDGFSSEQLDKLKDVLQQLKMSQIILVSHESKVETYVDSVIRIQKQDGISKVYNM